MIYCPPPKAASFDLSTLPTDPSSLLAAAAAACDAHSWWGKRSFPWAHQGRAARCIRQHCGYGCAMYLSVQTVKTAYHYPVSCLNSLKGPFFRNHSCALSKYTVSHEECKKIACANKIIVPFPGFLHEHTQKELLCTT